MLFVCVNIYIYVYVCIFLIQVAEYTILEEQLQKTLRDLDQRERQLLTAELEVKSLLSLCPILIKFSYKQSCDLYNN